MDHKDRPNALDMPGDQNTIPFDQARAHGASPPAEKYQFGYHGDGTEFFVLLLKNIVLTVLTLGIYAAWAKTERRKYIWSHTELHGQRLVYTGTGQELFIAYLKLVAAYIVFFVVPQVIKRAVSETAGTVVQVVMALLLIPIIPFAIYWSRAYLLSRTHWRGIRFGLAKEGTNRYAGTFILGNILTVLSLGFAAPYYINKLHGIMTSNTRFGTEPFRYDGRGKDLFFIMLKGVLLSIITLGIYWFWTQAQLSRYYLSHTQFSGARGHSEITGGFLFKVFLIHLFGTTLTLGLAFPWIATYTLREVLTRVSFHGHIDFATIAQRAGRADAGGEALADALDVGLGI